MSRRIRPLERRLAWSAGLVVALAPVFVPALAQAALPIFGGPTYSSSTQTGATPITLGSPGHSAAEGYAVGSATTYDPSTSTTWTPLLGYRWDTAGNVENLGNVVVVKPFDEAGDRHVTAIAPDHTAVGYALADSGGFSFPGTFGPPSSTAVFWDQSNTATTLAQFTAIFGPTVPEATIAYGMNRSHVIVGNCEVNAFVGAGTYESSGTVAVRWDSPTAAPVSLGAPSQATYGVAHTQAQFINDAGNIAGTYTLYSASDTDLGTRAVRWLPGSTTPVPLGDFGGDSSGHSTVLVAGQNAGGTIVGAAERDASLLINSGRVMGAARWDPASASIIGLGDLAHKINFHVNSQAYGINSAGTVIGYSAVGGSGFGSGERAVRWEAGSSVPVTLDTFGVSASGAATARGYAINSSGVSVGFSSRYNATGAFVANCAALWLNDASHSIVDLNSYLPAGSPWHLDSANDITTAGFITGTGTYDPPGSDAAYQRGFMILVPAAGTYGRGDANFDGHIDFADLLILAKRYGQSNATQHIDVADFDLNGTTDFSDLLTLARNYGTSAASAQDLAALPANVSADWALAQSLVPEPTMMVLLFAGVCVGSGRRRRSGTHN